MITLAVGKRNAGKSTAIVYLMKKINFDIIFVISPTFASNSILMNQLDIPEENVYSDPDDPGVVDDIRSQIESERDDLEEYLERMEEYKTLLKLLKEDISSIPDELLMSFYDNEKGQIQPPEHKYGGRNPLIGLLIDDCQSSKLFSSKKIQNMAIKHRHEGSFKTDRPSIGLSLFFLLQNYRASGGQCCPRTIRNNCTNALIFKSKDEKELEHIASEMSGEVSKETFLKAYNYAMNDGEKPGKFLFIDLHRKKEHPSIFRSRFNKFLLT